MDISIIICTYNPEQRIFERCLIAIKNLVKREILAEVIIVDNNSTIPVSSLGYVSMLLPEIPNCKVIIEREQGLAHARMAGFKNSLGKLIVFFDDDNEPYKDYIIQAKNIHDNRDFIGIMGPGNINVEYVDEVDPYIKQHFNRLFQEKKAEREEYIFSVMKWAPWYPPGTGQVMKRIVFEGYLDTFFQRGLKTLDRKGQNLSSAGDSQIIWSCLNLNYAVGHHPKLELNHLIPFKRANLTYLKRLNYHLALSGAVAFVEMYPEKKISIPRYSSLFFLYEVFKMYFNGLISKQSKSIKINIASLVGHSEAGVIIYQSKMPFLIRIIKRLYKIN
jgi:glycosyltransferase involved in cell wall biosynthesis